VAERPVDAWRAVMLSEAGAAYACAVAGPRFDDAGRAQAGAALDRHKAARDAAALQVSTAGAAVGPLPTFFVLPGRADDPVSAAALLAGVEARLAVQYADLLALLPLAQRQPALDGVLQCSAAALGWGARPGPWGAADPAAG
jgi:hypothetical protein